METKNFSETTVLNKNEMHLLNERLINRTRNNVHEHPLSNKLIVSMIERMHELLHQYCDDDIDGEITYGKIVPLIHITSDDLETQLFIMNYLTLFNV